MLFIMSFWIQTAHYEQNVYTNQTIDSLPDGVDDMRPHSRNASRNANIRYFNASQLLNPNRR